MIIAAIKAADLHAPSQTRALTLPKFKSHLLNILNQMQREVHNFVHEENVPDVTFIFGGYDWWNKYFRIWRIEFDAATSSFFADERTGSNALGGLGKIEIAGDLEWEDLLRKNIKELVQSRYGLDMRQPSTARFNMEPFECIRDLLKGASSSDSIGGAPQAVKIYQYLNSADVGFFWPRLDGGRLYLSGRPLLDYERANVYSVIDPDSIQSTWSNGNSEVAASQIRKALGNGASDLISDSLEILESVDEPPMAT